MKLYRYSTLSLISFCGVPALFAQFDPGPNPIVGAETSAQTLSSDTGVVADSGSLTVSGGGVAITVTGDSTLDNSGTIYQSGDGRAVRINTAPDSFTLFNRSGAMIQSADADTFQWNAGSSNTIVSLTNAGFITAENSGQALDFDDYEGTQFTLINQSTGTILAGGNVAILVGGTANITNAGFITSLDDRAIEAGDNSILTNSGTIESSYGDVIRLGDNSTINNLTGGVIYANPILDGGELRSEDGISLGNATGVEVINSGSISGRHGVTGGDDTFDITITNNVGGSLIGLNGSGVNIDGITATSLATVVNHGTIEGRVSEIEGVVTGDGDGVDVDGILTLTNSGVIAGLGAAGNDSGGNPNNSEGVAAGGGTITNLEGGEIYGRAMSGDLTREGRGILIDDGSDGSGLATTTVENAGTIKGYSSFAMKMVGNFDDSVTNYATGVIEGNGVGTGGAIQTGDGADQVINSGMITGNSGVAIQTEAGNDTVNILDGSVTGNIDGGADTDMLVFNLGSNGLFSYNDNLQNFETNVIQSGTVLINGADESLLTTVNSGAILGGTGQLQNVVLESGGMMAPGNSPGTLTIAGDLTFSGGSEFNFELGTASDLISIGDEFIFLGGGQAIINIVNAGGLAESDYTLFDFDSSTGLSASDFAFGNTPDGFDGLLTLNGGQLLLTVNTIPEPAAIWLALLAGGAMLWHRRSRR